MTTWTSPDSRVTLLVGDCLTRLQELPAESVHCCVTSPPYYALRKYLDDDHEHKRREIGSEPTAEAFVATMTTVFLEVWRVLRPDGVLWLNLGDSSDSSGKGGGGKNNIAGENPCSGSRRQATGDGQLQNIPHRVAAALRDDGWRWRQTVVWAKPAPMPESISGWQWVRCKVKVERGNTRSWYETGSQGAWKAGCHFLNDGALAKYEPCPGCPKCLPNDGWVLRRGQGRCTTAHEYLFLLTKGKSYYWDSAAFREPASGRASGNKQTKLGQEAVRFRNPRSVWTISAEPSKEKHFAAYPSELVRRCVQAATSDGGCCAACGAPWAPRVEQRTVYRDRPADRTGRHEAGKGVAACGNTVDYVETVILDYRPTCGCGAESIPCLVLDPFAGTGTTLQVARWMGRRAVGCELSPEYAEIVKRKVLTEPVCLRKQKRSNGKRGNGKGREVQRELFA